MRDYKIRQGLSNQPDARSIREAVFVKEQGFQVEFDEIDATAYHLIVYEEGQPAATGRVYQQMKEDGVYCIGRVAVLKNFRGRGLGAFVMEILEDFLKTKGAGMIEISAQIQAEGFYQKLGYREMGKPFMDEHCPHIKMRKKL